MSQKESGKRPQQQVAPPSFPPPSCPRCCSDNTKFCYYNNYTVSQPRYYCKDCRRYWTHGGAIRNIPTGGVSRKRGRIETASSSASQVLIPPATTTWAGLGGSGNPNGGLFNCATIGRGTFRPPITETMVSFNGGGHSNQTPFRFSAGGELGGVNAALGAVSVGFGGGALPPVDGFRDFGFHGVQPPQHHPLPPPSVWTTGQNMVLSSTSTTVSIARDPGASASASAHVVGVNEWCELNDIDYEVDALQS